MLEVFGKPVYQGIALGPVAVLKGRCNRVEKVVVDDAEAEISRIAAAGKLAGEQLRFLHEKAVHEVGEDSAAIFEAQQLLLEDANYLGAVHGMIREQMVNAEYAVFVIGNQYIDMLNGMEDEYLKARAADIKDISSRFVRNLRGKGDIDFSAIPPSIIVAEDLCPSETIQMDRKKMLGLVTVHGSTKSHTAILARMMNIPALVGVNVDLDEIRDGMNALVDGFKGTVVFEPSDELCHQAEEMRKREEEKLKLLQVLRGKENVTLDGRKIDIYANIGCLEDVECALENDAGGIGLFRSEFLYLGREDFPGEEEQFLAYRKVAEAMEGKRVIIRTLDMGGDKQADYLKLEEEANPAMGFRAIRICLKQPNVFRTQLRAIFRGAVFGNLSVMYPMITSEAEVRRIQEIANEVRQELEEEGVPFRLPEQGIMIETPAAVLISDDLAQLVEFFSIGTNDLTQYTLAIDRQNEKLDEFYDAHHKAVMRMIEMTVDNAHRFGKRVGICGELAADTEFTESFIRMGVDELSVASSMVLKVRECVRTLNMSER